MSNLIQLDDYGSIERMFSRDHNSSKFIFACYPENKHDSVASYIASNMNDMELCYLIDSLKEMRKIKQGEYN